MQVLDDVFSVMDQIKTVQPQSVFQAAQQQAQNKIVADSEALRTNPYLIERRVPNFEDGIAINQDGYVYGTKDFLRMLQPQHNRKNKRQYNIAFYGQAGTGKTALGYYLADLLNAQAIDENVETHKENLKRSAAGQDLLEYKALPYPIYHVSCHEASRSEDFTVSTKIVVKNGQTTMEEIRNAAVKAYSEGGILFIEEYDMAPPGVWAEMHDLLEPESKSVTYWANGYKEYHKHPNFLCIATGNTKGLGEAAVDFAGTQQQNKAFLSRFRWFEITYLPADTEIRILKDNGMRSDAAEKMVQVATRIRKAAKNDEFQIEMSLRDLISWGDEALDLAEVLGLDSSTSLVNYWERAVQPAAYPTFVNRAEETDIVGIQTYLKIV